MAKLSFIVCNGDADFRQNSAKIVEAFWKGNDLLQKCGSANLLVAPEDDSVCDVAEVLKIPLQCPTPVVQDKRLNAPYHKKRLYGVLNDVTKEAQHLQYDHVAILLSEEAQCILEELPMQGFIPYSLLSQGENGKLSQGVNGKNGRLPWYVLIREAQLWPDMRRNKYTQIRGYLPSAIKKMAAFSAEHDDPDYVMAACGIEKKRDFDTAMVYVRLYLEHEKTEYEEFLNIFRNF